MRTKSTGGFTLIELLIVIAIIGILAAVLIPNLLNARQRAFDTGTQACLRSIATEYEVQMTNHPFEYTQLTAAQLGAIAACDDVVFSNHTVTDTTFTIDGAHSGANATRYRVANGTGVITAP